MPHMQSNRGMVLPYSEMKKAARLISEGRGSNFEIRHGSGEVTAMAMACSSVTNIFRSFAARPLTAIRKDSIGSCFKPL